MNNLSLTAQYINTLGAFCGVRDVDELSQSALQQKYGFHQADVMVLFGGSILCGGDVLAQAIQRQGAKKYILVGGAGHTTETLRRRMHAECPDIETDGRSEAEIFEAYLEARYQVKADALETESTNCGNNITYFLRLIDEKHIPCRSVIFMQDATMQRRMAATLHRYRKEIQVINYAAYQAEVIADQGKLTYAKPIWGMWDMKRYVSLLLGEIVRLRDDENGYGPHGKNFIAHIDIPENVWNAFEALKTEHVDWIREADPAFASKK
ncbi:ElyC/SanA/YdcF family protein [Catenisphaera adipataccumulans]|uniref:Uncharacterized SAM-binding protein YcdF (DUF218 family) n=1 Tax=Catenisphaera adipataccumulans TaxID=700500 RepID=A0A7W8CVF0_9FIRM|nr:ElyC/SanA/YdcF family protein [Catenisphaera adipataccumulans]MBB5182293.1 uncharacterized SAM-binding protein YcdF (DUF218 family) [Catenisphaera adipataccumulans]